MQPFVRRQNLKIKIIKFTSREITGMMFDLQKDEIIAVDNSVGQQLIDKGYAEYKI